jgi:seryl-tRNA synthetase
MLDIKIIRNNPDILDLSLRKRGKEPQAFHILDLDRQYRQALTELQELQTQRNQIAKQFGEAKRKGEDTTQLSQQADHVKQQIAGLEGISSALQNQLYTELAGIPNLVANDVPEGIDESQNIEIRRYGSPKVYTHEIKTHFELGENLGVMDFNVATKLSGSRFVVLYSHLARLERALATFMLDIHTRQFGYTEVYPPLLVNEQTMFGTGQLPKFREDQFQTNHGLWLIPTAEVVLTNLVAEEILSESVLPLRYTAYTPCFRAEAGAAGRDTRGMIRQHQFGKVELVSITLPKNSQDEHERMTSAAEEVLRQLQLPFRIVTLCSGDLGFSAQKTYDIEVWLPSQNTYREISSCSNCGDFQARRMNARFRPHGTPENPKPATEFVHTLNGSGVAVGRAIVAIMENYQRPDGSIEVPEVLIPYMGGIELIQKT